MLLSLATVNIDRSEIMPVNFSNGLKKWRRGYCLLGPVVDEEMRVAGALPSGIGASPGLRQRFKKDDGERERKMLCIAKGILTISPRWK